MSEEVLFGGVRAEDGNHEELLLQSSCLNAHKSRQWDTLVGKLWSSLLSFCSF